MLDTLPDSRPPSSGPAMTAALSRSAWIGRLLERREKLLAALLLPLHGAVLSDLHSPWTRALLLVHLGLFLLWQPLWGHERRLGTPALVFIGAASVLVLFWLNWWLVAAWLAFLVSLVGARGVSGPSRACRLFGLAVLAYLLVTLLLWVVPKLFTAGQTPFFAGELMRYAMPVGLLLLLAFPVGRQAEGGREPMDFLYGLLLFLVVVLVVLGSFAFMTLSKIAYVEALIRTLLVVGFLLSLLGLLWNPAHGLSLLQPVLFRYLLNVGTPFEQWLARIAGAAERETDPAGFLHTAAERLAALPWVASVAWDAPDGQGQVGEEVSSAWTFSSGALTLRVSSRFTVGPALVLHLKLLTEIVAHFYEAKRREQALAHMARMQAIHETGARLTHDIKNLLQSLYALASASQQAGDAEGFQRLMRRQLPDLARRLELTLGKLKNPLAQGEGETPPVTARAWWEALESRYESRGVRFRASFAGDVPIPGAFFDSVAENLLENALKKRQQSPGLEIDVELAAGEGRAVLRVTDTGEPVPARVAGALFDKPVASETGLGVGLYQVSREAARHGYILRLKENRPGRVCFELAPRERS
ncbi:sensor histidine kinase [Pelomicrobium sp.]|uniref:sensor histidine kinase n=1 Tax=Pelomicrobium sp. TaxID=2815319 RepID=UPI002FDE0B8A